MGKVFTSTQRKWREKRARDALLGRGAEADAGQRAEGLQLAAEAADEEAKDALARRRQGAVARRAAARWAAAPRDTLASRMGPKMVCLRPSKRV